MLTAQERGGASMADVKTRRDNGLIGNRLALAGAVLYLLEWVAIIAASPPGPFGLGTAPSEVVRDYATHAGAAALSAGWFAIVLIGRILYISGVKASLRGRPRELPLLDFALGAMTVSVVLEVGAYSLVAGTARLAADGGNVAVVRALDDGAYWLNLMIWGPAGASVLAAALAMLRSRLFASWLCWLGVVAGVAGVAGCLVAATTSARTESGATGAVTSVAALGMWVWMVGTGVVLFRRADRGEQVSTAPPGVAAAVE
jgi:hypothetical protein